MCIRDRWMSIGFIHGVMNTDNMTISGETIDYGPCAFMNGYDTKTVFSSIDHNGRYAYLNQPAILVWNLAKFAENLVPLVNENPDKSVKQLTEVLHSVMPSYQEFFYKELSMKLGLSSINNKNMKLINDFLKMLESEHVDLTISFRNLSKINLKKIEIKESVFADVKNFTNWYQKWKYEVKKSNIYANNMDNINPCYIPRNHIIEDALKHAMNNDYSKIKELNRVLQKPYNEVAGLEAYASPPQQSDINYVTYCGT